MENVFKGSEGWKALDVWREGTGWQGEHFVWAGAHITFLDGRCVSPRVTNEEWALFVFAALIRCAAALCVVLQSKLYIGKQ